MSYQTVTVRRVMDASREEVFDAWLDAEGMREWMCPGPVTHCDATMDARPGGRFRIVMHGPDMTIVNTGEFRVLERPAKLQFTWASSRWGLEETLITIDLLQREARCELVLTHERFPANESAAQLQGGWGRILVLLADHLRGSGT
ncbi:MAG TPA: SRPBCC domain-containing protein [Bryobacteraceae bacterium]|jgi:uncharacterized protein YndB with AHSA1/START domain